MSVKLRHPLKHDLINDQGKLITTEEGVQYLRELAVVKVIYSDLDDNQVSKDPDSIRCTWAIWREVSEKCTGVICQHPDNDELARH